MGWREVGVVPGHCHHQRDSALHGALMRAILIFH